MATVSKPNSKKMVASRIPADLAKLASAQAAQNNPPQSLSDFLKESIANEVSRRCLAKPLKALTVNELSIQLAQVQMQLDKQVDISRLTLTLIQSIARQVGIKTE